MKNKRILASFLTAVMAFSSLPINAFAEVLPNPPEDSKNNTAEAVLTQEATIFSATVPTALPINVDANNNVTVATNATVVNDSYGPILVTGITLNNKNGWERVEIPEQKVGKKQFSFDISLESMSIAAKSNTKIVYNSKVSPQKDALNNVPVQDVIFTIGWNSVNHSEISALKEKIAINEQTKLSIPVVEGEAVTWKNSNPSIAKIITKTRSNNSSEVIAGGEVEIKALNIGTTNITAIDENGNTFTKEIVVVENSLQSIYIATQPAKTSYRAGEIFDPTGMAVKAVYLNGDEWALSLYSYQKTPLTEGQTSVEVSYDEKGIFKSANVPVFVDKAKMTITIQSSVGGTVTTDKTEATEGEIVTVTASPNTDYVFKSISVNGTPITGNTFVMPNKEVTVSAIFDKIIYPAIGTKFEDATYEYSFGQSISFTTWTNSGQMSWGAKLKNKAISGKIPAPLTQINNCPVTNLDFLLSQTTAAAFDLSLFDTSNITSMYGMFWLSKVTFLDLTMFNTSKVTNMQQMFDNCAASNINLSSFDTTKVTNFNYMFYGSKAIFLDLSSFDMPDNVDGKSNAIGMFQGAAATNGYAKTTKDVNILNKIAGRQMFFVFGEPLPLKIGTKFEDTTYEYSYGQAFHYNEWVNTGKEGWGVRLKNRAQSGTIPSPLTEIRSLPVTNLNFLFAYSTAKSLDLSLFDTRNATDLSAMFFTSAATSLDLRSFDVSKVETLWSLFDVTAATTIDVSNWDTSNVKNMWYTFYATNVRNLDLSGWDTSNVTTMYGMFREAQGLTFLDLSSFDTSNVTNTEYMFNGTKITGGYARTAIDAAKLNSSLYKPAGLTFVVK